MGFTESLEKIPDIEFNAWFLKGARPLAKQYFYENVIISDGERRKIYFHSQLKERIENLISLNGLMVDNFDSIAFLILSNAHSNLDIAAIINPLKLEVEGGLKPFADVLKFVKFGLSLYSRKLASAAEIILQSARSHFGNRAVETELFSWLRGSLNITFSKRIISVLKDLCAVSDATILGRLEVIYDSVPGMRLHYVTMIFRLYVDLGINFDNQFTNLCLNVPNIPPIPSVLLSELSPTKVSSCSPPYKQFLLEIANKWVETEAYFGDESGKLYRILDNIIQLSLFDNELANSLKTVVKALLKHERLLRSHPIALKYGSD